LTPAASGCDPLRGQDDRVKSSEALVPVLCWLAGWFCAAQSLRVRIYDYSVLPAATLKSAEQQAENIFQQAGVELRWVECGVSPDETAKLAACDQVLAQPHSADVKLIPASMEKRLPRPTERFAIAIPSTVFVFCQRIHDAAEMTLRAGS
jgi:hypothetical protein